MRLGLEPRRVEADLNGGDPTRKRTETMGTRSGQIGAGYELRSYGMDQIGLVWERLRREQKRSRMEERGAESSQDGNGKAVSRTVATQSRKRQPMIHPTQAHKRGRATFDVPDRRWPVVTATMVKMASDLSAPLEHENPLVKHLLTGYVYLASVELNLKRALTWAKLKEDERLICRLEAQLARAEQLKEEWPLEIVG